jgi:hypothetical protein
MVMLADVLPRPLGRADLGVSARIEAICYLKKEALFSISQQEGNAEYLPT